MPAGHQAIMRQWVGRLAGLIDKTNVLVRTGSLFALMVDEALRNEANVQEHGVLEREQSSSSPAQPPLYDPQTAAVMQNIELAF